MRIVILLNFWLCTAVLCGMFSDILKGLIDSDSPRLTAFVKGLPNGVIDSLESDEEEAGQFVCQVMAGNVPGVIEDLADDVWDEIKDDWTAVTSFIESIPSLAPAILDDLIQDGEDVVSVVGDIFTNPKAAVTAVLNGVEVVVSDIEQVGEEVWSGIECLFKKCNKPSTTGDPAATISASCQAIMKAATTTYSVMVTSSAYPTAQTSASLSAVPTTAVAATAVTSAYPSSVPTTTTTSSSSTIVKSTTTSQTSTDITPSAHAASSGSRRTPSAILQAWTGVLVSFLLIVLAL